VKREKRREGIKFKKGMGKGKEDSRKLCMSRKRSANTLFPKNKVSKVEKGKRRNG